MKLRTIVLPTGETAVVVVPETMPEAQAWNRHLVEDPQHQRLARVILGTAPSAESVDAGAGHAEARAHVLPIRSRS